jgi:Peptidase M50B-like
MANRSDQTRFSAAQEKAVQRLHQAVLIASVVLGSWLGMQAVHEFGHVLGAWLTGGEVDRVVLHPLTISRTDLAHNPSPLLVVWAGPVVGVLLPAVAWGVAAGLRLPGAFVLRFFAGFCLVANGAYIAGGSFDRIGDCGQMLRHGSPVWQLWLFGAVAVPAGLWLWHRQGVHFGLGPARGQVNPGVAYVSLVVCVALAALGFLVGGE